MGSAIGLAAIAVAIDHTRHRLPEPQPQSSRSGQDSGDYAVIEGDSPCTLTESPCALDDSPCSLEIDSPCSL
jgi:hypothetical protein